MRTAHGLLAAALVVALSPLARADEVAVNGGFETAGSGGATDSLAWTEFAAGAPGIHFFVLNRAASVKAVLGALLAARPWERAAAGAGLAR